MSEKKQKLTMKEKEEKISRGVIEHLLTHPNMTKKKITPLKCRIGGKYKYPNVIKNSVIRGYATEEELPKVERILRRRNTRTLSGVTIVAVMTKPYECPGDCIFCPGPDSQPGKKVAQSYTGREPAAMRSAMYNYDPYEQTFNRLKDLTAIGHHVDKIELIIMGGTFLYFPIEYQDEFMKGCYDAVINFGKDETGQQNRTSSIEEAKKKLETSATRLIGVTFETRPDYSFEEHIDRILSLGATRIEIGIQSTDDELLKLANRQHTVAQNQKAIQVAKDSGLKVNAHMMPNLLGSSPEKDYSIFQELFENPLFRPDMLKIYPTLVVEGTKLYELWKNGEYKPYSQDEVISLLGKVKSQLVPRYVRIQRIQRDIPMDLIIDGVKNSNLRQMVQRNLKKLGTYCNCIRCREHGFYTHSRKLEEGKVDDFFSQDRVQLLEYEYNASSGKEIFLSFEDAEANVLIGYLRLRFPSEKAHRPEINSVKSGIVREIRVVGEIVEHKVAPDANQIQHRGYGKRLLERAEEICKSRACEKILIISGIGVREYFYNQGYKADGPYVSKIF